MVLDTLSIFFEMRLAFFFFFVFICIFRITYKYAKTICVDNTIFLSLLILENLVSVCSTDNCLGFFWGVAEEFVSMCGFNWWFTKRSYVNLLENYHIYIMYVRYVFL